MDKNSYFKMPFSLKQGALEKRHKVQIPDVVPAPIYHMLNPLTDNKILDWSELKQIADDIVKCI